MEKINKIVKTLTEDEYRILEDQVSSNNADKSLQLLRFSRENNLSDKDCIKELDIKPNAFYTLKSRLGQKIYNFLVSKMEAPKLDLIKKVAFAGELMFTAEKEVVSATLKRLEKQLADYDLPYELTKIYQNLKKVYVNHPDQFYTYSQLYNKHVAFTLALDRAEEMVGQYFNLYGQYFFSREDTELIQINIIHMELNSMCDLYDSHRLYIYSSLVKVFSILFIPNKFDKPTGSMGDIEDIFEEVDAIFLKYENDPFYFQLSKCFDYLKLEYYHRLNLGKKEWEYYEILEPTMGEFLKYLNYYLFTPRLLFTKLEMYREAGKLEKLANENESFLPELNADKKDTYLYVVSKIYEAVSLMYDKKVEDAIRCLNNLRYDVTLRHLPHAEMEVKLLTACGYAMVNEADLCTTLIKSIQRQIRNTEEEMDGADYEDARIMLKILTKMVNFRENKQVDKVEQLIERFERNNKGEKAVIPYFDTQLLLKYY